MLERYACTSKGIFGAIQRGYYDGKEVTDNSVYAYKIHHRWSFLKN